MSDTGPLAFFVPSLTVGGAERVTVTVANGLADHGYDVDLVVPHYGGAFVDEVNNSVDVFDLDTSFGPGIGIGMAVPALVSYFRDRSPAMIFSQMTYANDVCLFAHMLAGSDAVAVPTVHNTIGNLTAPKDRLVRVLAQLLEGRVDQFVAVSDGVADSIVAEIGVDRADVSVLHNPIPVDDIREEATGSADHRWIERDDTDVVLGVGRLEPQKSFKTFLRAFGRVHERLPSTRAVIIGRGSKRDELEALAADLGLSDVVSFPGYVDNPYAYMAGADTLMMSSVHEGLPTVLIEAMACGCPVVSTDCPSGPRTILEDGQYGPLVEVGDDAALAAGVLATLRDPLDERTLIERARDFQPSTVLADYETFVQEHGPFEREEPAAISQ